MKTEGNCSAKGTSVFILSKKIPLVLLLVFIGFPAICQNKNDSTSPKGKHYFLVRARHESGKTSLFPGERIVLLRKTFDPGDRGETGRTSHRIISGTLNKLSQDYFTLTSGHRIEISQVTWIRKTKSNHVNVFFGALITAGGLAILEPVLSGDACQNDVLPRICVSAGLIISGTCIMSVAPKKFRPHRGDRLVYSE